MDEITVAAHVDIKTALKEIGNDKIIAYIKKENLQDYFKEGLCFDIEGDITDFATDELIDELKDRGGRYQSFEESEMISTGRSGRNGDELFYSASNLLDIQIMEAFKEIMESNINHIDFLRHLQGISRNGLKPAA